MTKHRSPRKRRDDVEKAPPSRHADLGMQRPILDERGADETDEASKMVDVASVGRPILGEYRSVRHGW